MCMFVCVGEREREIERKGEWESQRETESNRERDSIACIGDVREDIVQRPAPSCLT